MHPLTTATLRRVGVARVVAYEQGRPFLYDAYLDKRGKPVVRRGMSVMAASAQRNGTVTMGRGGSPIFLVGYGA